MAQQTSPTTKRKCLELKGVRSHPVSTSRTIRRHIEEMCRTANVSFQSIADNDGFLDERSERKAREALRKNQNCRIRIVEAT